MLLVEVPGFGCRSKIPVCHSNRLYLSSTFLSEKNDERIGIMVEICNRVSFISIAIRSNVQVYNYLNLPIQIFYKIKEVKTLNLVGQIEKDGVFDVPLSTLHTPAGELFFQPQG